MNNQDTMPELGSAQWNDEMYQKHSTPYKGIAGYIELKRVKKIFSIARKKLSGKSVFLEVGCEQGNMLVYFCEKLAGNPDVKIMGADISAVALKDAAAMLKDKAVLIEHDITSDTLPSLPPVDVLVCSEALEHIPDYNKAIEQLSKIAGKDTLVIITVPLEKYKNRIKNILLKTGLFNLLFKGIEESLSEWHVNDFSKEDITGALAKYFEVKDYSLLMGLHQIITLKKK